MVSFTSSAYSFKSSKNFLRISVVFSACTARNISLLKLFVPMDFSTSFLFLSSLISNSLSYSNMVICLPSVSLNTSLSNFNKRVLRLTVLSEKPVFSATVSTVSPKSNIICIPCACSYTVKSERCIFSSNIVAICSFWPISRITHGTVFNPACFAAAKRL